MDAVEFIISRILAGERNLDAIKRQASGKYGKMVKNPAILERFPKDMLTSEIKALLLKKPAKTLSGVTPVAVMIKPENSCRWNCIYCPFTGLAAKSYTGFEPAAMRAKQFNFDPYLQSSGRVKQFEGGGHATDKCEVIIMGGTFLEMDENYKRSFIQGVYEGLNGERSPCLEEAIAKNETSRHRAIGLTIETRPNICNVDEMLSYGATRCELGVQHADDEIYRLINRGHTVQDVIDSTENLKDSGFKVLYHIMPGLPGSSPEKDISFVKKLFQEPSFRPDMLKIYPTLVMEGTILHSWMKDGKYRPYSTEESAEIISEFYRYIPKYVRVMRIQRDIPAGKINSGVKKSNLRELVESRIREKGIMPMEIRYREAGLNKKVPEEFFLHRFDYDACKGREVFLSYENNLIAGFLRMRFPGESPRKEIDNSTAIIRELHIYGSSVPISEAGEIQHKGMGLSLLMESEKIAKEQGYEKMVIISGVGVRQYYARHGYSRLGPYMAKKL
ncbi:tRNA uridine(34) 5-carboxymethylaminomethyl modification radical SAM/GNAT enzyme Elp3 [Candidatus Micrarchaeota archaeon]|nr:tRNA uridine(34) 5-carboxymethylaminomethyl modification radical SAM/GNAT enzyme Elp3 [Candidatus Micrarchaeota archaeon]